MKMTVIALLILIAVIVTIVLLAQSDIDIMQPVNWGR
jgi:hypothetical protein